MTLTATQLKTLESFRTPKPDDPLWLDNPPPSVEDPEDKRTPTRVRETIGDVLVLVEQLNYIIPPPPEAREKAKKRGEKAAPFRVEQYRVHLWHTVRGWTRTIKVYRHGSERLNADTKIARILYADSADHDKRLAGKTAPPKDRGYVISILAGALGVSPERADLLLSGWTNGR